MMARRRTPSPAGPSTIWPPSSGPRWTSVTSIASTAVGSIGAAASSATTPQMPHTWRLLVEHLAHDVGALALRLVVGAHQQLAQKTHQDRLEAHQEQHGRQPQQRRL